MKVNGMKIVVWLPLSSVGQLKIKTILEVCEISYLCTVTFRSVRAQIKMQRTLAIMNISINCLSLQVNNRHLNVTTATLIVKKRCTTISQHNTGYHSTLNCTYSFFILTFTLHLSSSNVYLKCLFFLKKH